MVVRIIAGLVIGITAAGLLCPSTQAAIEFSEEDAAGDPAESGVVDGSQPGVPPNAGATGGGAAMASTTSDSATGTNGVGSINPGFGGGFANGAAGSGGEGGGGSQANDDAPDGGSTPESEAGSVPEPTTLLIWSVLAACALGLYRIRKRR